MSLIPCPECGREISTNAEACPHCGNPMRPAGPKCYACSATATTKCQRCGALSCVEHLKNIYANRGWQLRCGSCYSLGMARKTIGLVIIGIFLLLALVAMLSHH
jgi:hypothetical protein